MNLKAYLKKTILNFFIIITIIFALIFILLKTFENEFYKEIANIEIAHAFNLVYKIRQIINSKEKEKNRLLNYLISNDVKYIYVIKKFKNKLRYIYDGSPLSQRAIYLQPFEPVNKKLWQKLFISKSPVFETNKKADGIWLTFLYPILKKNKIDKIIVVDISLEAYNKFKNLLHLFNKLFLIISIIVFSIIILMNFFMFRLYKEQFESFIDPLTKTYNRKILETIEKENLQNDIVAIFDIDNFKKINDTYGHNAGDIVLKQLVNIIKKHIRDYDYLIRYGGEEFVLLLKRLNKKHAVKKIEQIFEAIRKTSIDIGNQKINITISGGVHLEPNKEKNLLEAIKKADQELYLAKKNGKNRFYVYSESIDNKIFNLNDIIESIEKGNVTIYLQPILNIKTNKIEKFEALARIYHNNKIYLPCNFINEIKKTNVYRNFTYIILDLVFNCITHLQKEISINFFAEDFYDEKFINIIEEKAQKYNNVLNYLTIEILENEKIENIKELSEHLNKLREKNIKISIDDFGSDYSNLNYLIYIKPDYIKIDSSIVKFVKNEESQKIIKSIVLLAKEFKATTIAEFVEDKESLEILKTLKVDYIQGYYISKPLPLDEIKKIYLKNSISA